MSDERPWYEDALCGDYDAELFFPSGRGAQAARQIAQAKLICRQCPVRDECLEFALQGRHTHGIWGGLTVTELNEAQKERVLRSSRAL